MSLYNDASLLLIPSGYKSGKVYSQKPTDGSGDLTFTRASSATRVNSDGLIESPRTNLLLQSNTFDTSWIINGTGTITGGQNGYDGTNNAWKLDKSAASTYIGLSTSSSGINTFSIYAKAGTNTHIAFWIRNANRGKFFDLVNGTVGSDFIGTPIDAQIQSMGNGWYRCSIVVDNADNNCRIYPADADGDVSGTSGNIFIQDAQLETGDIATDYIPTTTAAVSVGMTANVPRLDYTNSSCPSLLLEPQRTNSVLYSEQFDNAAWYNEDIIVSTNQTISPDGTQNADKLAANTTTLDHSIYQNTTIGSLTTYSVYAKAAEYNYIFLGSNNNTATAGAFFNLSDGTISQNTSSLTASIESVGNGWYRCIVSANSWPKQYAMICLSTNGTSFIFTGNNTSGVYVWGAQLEAGSYATSYIPTLGTSVTRVADSCYKTGISSLIGGTSGTVFFDITTNPSLSSANYKQFCYYFDSASAQSYMYLNSVNQLSTNINWGLLLYSTPLQPNTRYKVALVYAPNDFALYVNGVSVATASSGTPKDNVNLQIGQLAGTEMCEFKFNQYTHFPSRLSNTDCEVITGTSYDSYSAMATALNYTVL